MIDQICKRLNADDSAGVNIDNHLYVVRIKHKAALICNEIDVNCVVVKGLGHPICLYVVAQLCSHCLRFCRAIVAGKLFGFFGNIRIVAVKAQDASVLRQLDRKSSAVLSRHFKQLRIRLAFDCSDIAYAFDFIVGENLAQIFRQIFGSLLF